MSKAAELANLIGNINAGGGGVNRNLIINGNFLVAQRGTSFSNVTSSQFCLDRFSVDIGGGGAFNVTQDTSAPEGFEKSLKIEVNTADSSIGAGDSYRVTQAIEGQNTAQVELGASTAKVMALSFYVKSSVTGTYGVGLANSAETENFVAEYTISSANTWEKKTINIPVRTSGTWLTNNGIGIGVRFDLGSGTDYNGTAGQWQTTSAKVYRTSSCVWLGQYRLQPEMRAEPTFNADGTFKINASGADMNASNIALSRATPQVMHIECNTTDADRVGQGAYMRAGADSDAFLEFKAEI
jgi:hypothetical protein